MEEFKDRRALYVGEIDDDIDLNAPPTTGEEYIKRVVLEAKQCLEVVVKPIDEKQLIKQTKAIKPIPSISDIPTSQIIPVQEWQNMQVKDFSKVRMYIARLRCQKESVQTISRQILSELPDVNDEKSWLSLCTNDSAGYLSPKVKIILSLSQPMTEQLLEYLIKYIQTQQTISKNVAGWIYALLVSLELPLNPDTCSSLRLLARCCQTMRLKLNSSDLPEMKILCLFVCLVARYFRQLDLADE